MIEQADKLIPVEIKSGQTVARDFFDGLKKFQDIAGKDSGQGSLIYGGSGSQTREQFNVIGWQDIGNISKDLGV